MIPLSCANCWFNGLQDGVLFGLSIGYCTEHRCVLNQPHETTCGRLRRKDLPLDLAEQEHSIHESSFDSSNIVFLRTSESANGAAEASVEALAFLREDSVGDTVADYGELGAKIESLAQLRRMEGARAEHALLSLSRAYVNRCVSRSGGWTSGVHLLWWTRKRLSRVPEIAPEDLAFPSTLDVARRAELARWSLMMLRLLFVSDVARYAELEGHQLSALRGLAQAAASATGTFNSRRLSRWIKSHAEKEFDRQLPAEDYSRLARALHRERDRDSESV